MRIAGGLLLLIAAVPAMAQQLAIPSATYPFISSSGANAGAFVPDGWAIERQARGDISGDGRDDLAIVVKQADPAFVLTNESLGVPRLDTNPRILIVAVGSATGFRLKLSNHRLIPRHEIPTMSDPFGEDGGLAIERGSLKISLFSFANAGGWDMGTTAFTFRWSGNTLQLIGYDRDNVGRNSGDTSELSINFLNRRVKESHGRTDSDGSDAVRWHRLRSSAIPTIDKIDDWQSFNPDGWVNRVFG
ncbi:hypothetical protein LZ518_07295 [Sphingomonas sp. RB56-2]|uniref:VCBS repeat-containing protein n=1 Tax=Sphingomonas brevis TaxID=2908206 RepID=A0ABT0S965_9SPHN|nr:hypothetical protein [Sphingomonas brevis]MCL6740934.1 hypothetical protein [Sphingomonas brevis]